MNFGVLFETYEWSYIPIMLIIFSISTTFIYGGIYSAVPNSLGFNVMKHMLNSSHFWLTFLLILVTCFVPRLAIGYYFTTCKPTDIQIAKELESEMNHKSNGKFSLHLVNPTPKITLQSKTSSTVCRTSVSHGTISFRHSVLPKGESTLEITDIHHAGRDSVSLPRVTIPIILSPRLCRRSQLPPLGSAIDRRNSLFSQSRITDMIEAEKDGRLV